MAVTSSSAVTLSTTAERTAMASSAESTGSIAKTPDYHLPWSGEVVEQALKKAIDLNVDEVGGVKVVQSTESKPANIDGLVDPGEYTSNYISATDLPEDLQGVTPTKITVYTKDGVLYQVVEGLGDVWVRFSSDEGDTWSAWSPKPMQSGGINTEDPEVVQPDEFETLKKKVEGLSNSVSQIEGDIATWGTAEVGAAMLDGTYDYSATAAAES